MKTLDVRDFGDLVAYKVVQTDTCDPAIDFVVDPGVAAVVVAVFVRGMRVVGVGHGIAQAAVCLGAHDFLGLVGNAPTHQGIRYKTGNSGDLTARWQAQHPHITGMATAPQAVVGVKFAGFEVGRIGAGVSCCGWCGWRGTGRCGRSAWLFSAGDDASQTGQCGGVDKRAPPDGGVRCGFCFFVLTHLQVLNKLPVSNSIRTGWGHPFFTVFASPDNVPRRKRTI